MSRADAIRGLRVDSFLWEVFPKFPLISTEIHTRFARLLVNLKTIFI
jgi:hypothetical protein